MAKYIPPVQGKLSQFIDVIVLLAMSIGALYMPLLLGMAGAAKTPGVVENPTWESLGQNAAQSTQYEALGYTPETAADLITARFDYSFSTLSLIIMAIIIIGYFVLTLKLSDAEYREVIAEKFGGKK